MRLRAIHLVDRHLVLFVGVVRDALLERARQDLMRQPVLLRNPATEIAFRRAR